MGARRSFVFRRHGQSWGSIVRLEHKIILIVLLTLGISFLVFVTLGVRRETESLTTVHHDGSRLAASVLVAGIRNVMMSGEGVFAREIVDEIRRDDELMIDELRVFDNQGNEVYEYVDFASAGVGAAPDSLAQAVVERPTSGGEGAVVTPSAMMDGTIVTRALPRDSMQNRLGAVRLGLMSSPLQYYVGDDLTREITQLQMRSIVEGYKAVMLSGKAEHMARFAEKAGELYGITELQVYDNQGRATHFGTSMAQPSGELALYLGEALGNVPVAYTSFAEPDTYTQLYPLENEARCFPCHGRDHLMRGVIRISSSHSRLQRRTDDPNRTAALLATEAISHTTYSVIEYGGKDVFVREFLEKLQQYPNVMELSIYDTEGRQVPFSLSESAPSRHGDLIERAITSVERERTTFTDESGERFQVDFVPVRNTVQCWQCHSSEDRVRAVIQIGRSLRTIDDRVTRSRLVSIVAAVMTMLVIWLAILVFMRAVVVRPVGKVVNVVQEVGGGNLRVRCDVESKDEIGYLSEQINEMIEGLLKRFHLEKFVSRATAQAVDQAGELGVALGGARRDVVVFFSDVRGFTAFSESIPPEEVVTMLNIYLRAQAKVVNAHGGQIDKYVGDELMAVFLDEEDLGRAARRAIECAKQTQRVLDKLRATGRVPKVHIGIGINAGPAVMGAIGSEERMDFTVIGDTVNTGARLCGAAGPGEIYISESVRTIAGERENEDVIELEPMEFKNKSEPFKVFEVREKREGERDEDIG